MYVSESLELFLLHAYLKFSVLRNCQLGHLWKESFMSDIDTFDSEKGDSWLSGIWQYYNIETINITKELTSGSQKAKKNQLSNLTKIMQWKANRAIQINSQTFKPSVLTVTKNQQKWDIPCENYLKIPSKKWFSVDLDESLLGSSCGFSKIFQFEVLAKIKPQTFLKILLDPSSPSNRMTQDIG